ncbi:DUF378 domain-containing protein [Candidatus Daviesbacteria bacterium]|nr:DUF378 domain-containing protein [Candidatus Daviesbacteria bacterium]
MKLLHILSYTVLWIGGLNWGLVGLLDMNLVENVLGADLAKWVYILVGLATVYIVVTHRNDCKVCGGK